MVRVRRTYVELCMHVGTSGAVARTYAPASSYACTRRRYERGGLYEVLRVDS